MGFRLSIFDSNNSQNLNRAEQKNGLKRQNEQENFFNFQNNSFKSDPTIQQKLAQAPALSQLYFQPKVQKNDEKKLNSSSIFKNTSVTQTSLLEDTCNVSDIAKSLVLAIQSKDSYTGEHSEAVKNYAESFAKKLNLSGFQTECLTLGAAFHDIGKIGIPEAILNKKDRLTDDEYEQIKNHADIGSKILDSMPVLKENIGKIVRYHHESWDGSGYPENLKGNQIPLEARVISIIDSYHAMTSNRPYRKGMSKEKAAEILQDGAGKQWDPELVEKFIEIIPSL